MKKKKDVTRRRAEDTRNIRRADTFAAVYANDIAVLTTPWDLRLQVGRIDRYDNAGGAVDITVFTDVLMSPPLAKKLLAILGRQIDAYETQVGHIPDID